MRAPRIIVRAALVCGLAGAAWCAWSTIEEHAAQASDKRPAAAVEQGARPLDRALRLPTRAAQRAQDVAHKAITVQVPPVDPDVPCEDPPVEPEPSREPVPDPEPTNEPKPEQPAEEPAGDTPPPPADAPPVDPPPLDLPPVDLPPVELPPVELPPVDLPPVIVDPAPVELPPADVPPLPLPTVPAPTSEPEPADSPAPTPQPERPASPTPAAVQAVPVVAGTLPVTIGPILGDHLEVPAPSMTLETAGAEDVQPCGENAQTEPRQAQRDNADRLRGKASPSGRDRNPCQPQQPADTPAGPGQVKPPPTPAADVLAADLDGSQVAPVLGRLEHTRPRSAIPASRHVAIEPGPA